uniref:Peptidase S1 domain-containing protein n=1 Tax=Glossina brevipalpis TaxID=37001 RepID=A0A1A9WPT7_9MUSC
MRDFRTTHKYFNNFIYIKKYLTMRFTVFVIYFVLIFIIVLNHPSIANEESSNIDDNDQPRHLTNDQSSFSQLYKSLSFSPSTTSTGTLRINGKQPASSASDLKKSNEDSISSEYYDDDSEEDNATSSSESGNSDSNESSPRLLSQSTINRISETLGALNTVGHLLVDMTRGGHETKTEIPNTISSSTSTTEFLNEISITTTTSTPHQISPNVSIQSSNNMSDTQSATKRIGEEEPVQKPMFVENKEVKKKKKKKNKNRSKIKKPSGEMQMNNSISFDKIPTTLRPFITTSTVALPNPSVSANQLTLVNDESAAKDVENRCRTPSGRPGRCEDLSSCPALLLNLSSLRESLCFKSLFVPGVCCPIPETSTILTTQRPLKLTTKRPVTTATTKKPQIRPSSPPPSLVLIPQIKPSTSTTISPVESNGGQLNSTGNENVIDPEDCGQQEYSAGRIVGGVESPNGQWPWMAAIFLHGSKRTEFWCGGSLIGSKYILTAAHCTRDSRQKPFAARQFTVRLGDIDLSTDAEPSAPVTFAVKEVRAHERFSRIGFYNDIAILVLDKPVRKSKYVIPVCLPKMGRVLPKERLPGRRATVVGWGTTYYGGKESTTQRQAELPIWRNDDCDRSYFQPINENFICAGYSDGGVDACQGDSGGPLMMRYDSRWIQLGVVSFGNKCGEPGYPGVYTRLTQYLDWIRDHTKD